jgi:DNA invertase Pin-like site-specific DNA recombinase
MAYTKKSGKDGDHAWAGLRNLLELVGQLDEMNAFRASGSLIFHVFGALAEFERNLICDLTQAGLNERDQG